MKFLYRRGIFFSDAFQLEIYRNIFLLYPKQENVTIILLSERYITVIIK